MEAMFNPQPRKHYPLSWTILLGFLIFGSKSLTAAPEVLTSYFEEGVIEVLNEVNTLTGARGNLSVRFIVEYNLDTSFSTLNEGDIKVVGTGQSNMGLEIPVTFISRTAQSPRVATYEIGPLDTNANGPYSIQIVEGAVSGTGGSLPAGEIYTFRQEVSNPMPEILKIYPLQIDGEEVTGDGSSMTLEGPYGTKRVHLFIDFSKETEVYSVNNLSLVITGESGDATGKTFEIQMLGYDQSQEDRFTAQFRFGRLDSMANGVYSVKVVEGTIKAIGTTENPATLPAGEILSITQNVTNPPPVVLTQIEPQYCAEYFPPVTKSWDGLTVYYNLSVDPNSIDSDDLIITGASPNNDGQVITLNEFQGPDVTVSDQIWAPGYISATYYFGSEEDGEGEILKEMYNGLWNVQVREGAILSMENPSDAVPAELVGTFRQAVIDPFYFSVSGRIYLEKEGTTPSLVDDGWETDEGLPLGYNAKLESPIGGGAGNQRISFFNNSNEVLFPERDTNLSPDIVSILVEGEYRYFEVAGNLENQFPYGSHFEVTDSTGNNGMYTVNWASYNYQNCGDQLTRIQVNETIPSDVGDGRIVKGSVSSTITIDGTDFDVTFSPDEIPTFGDLLSKLNELFEGTGHIFIATTDTLTVESASFGSQSTVQITEPEDGTGLFQNLGGFLGNSTPGSDEWRNVGGNEYIPPDNFEDEDDWGRMVFSSFNPGIYRIRLTFGEIFTGEVDEFGFPITIDIPPPPQVAIQALGDPNRDGEPKDHTMYFTVNRSMSGENLTVNFSYLEEMDPPHLMYDEIQVLAGSQGTRLNVLANDGNPPGNNEDLTIVGLGLWEGADFLNDDLPTELTGNSQGYQNRSWTDGKYVYYDSPGYFYELFYYIVEDSEGNRDWTEIYIDPVFEITNQFAANEDFATVPITASRARINVLANDSVAGGGSKENLVITEVSTPTAGGTVSFEGTDVFYQPPPNFTGTDTFEYTMTDNYSGTATTKVTVIVTNSPVPEGQRGLLNLLLKLFGASRGGAAVFEFWNKHISEFDYLVLDQSEGSVAAKANGKLPFSSRHNGGTAETQANWNAILDMAESGIAATLAGQGDSVVVTQEFVDRLMAGIADVQERASPDFKADLQTICEMTNDFQDLVGKTFGEGFAILGLPPEDISIPNLALERINDVLSITTWDVAGLAFKLWKSNNLQPDSWEEVQNAEIKKEGAMAKISDPDVGDEDAFYRVTSDVE